MKSIRKNRLSLLLLLLILLFCAGLAGTIKVHAAQKYSIRVTKKGKEIKTSLQEGDKLQLQVKNGSKTISYKKVSFSSSDKNVASVSRKGKIAARLAGTATITIQYKMKSARIIVTVSEAPLPVMRLAPVGTKTIKCFLSNALVPVGTVLYVWGGGWYNATTIGVPSVMRIWYNSQPKSYDYHKYYDLTAANREKGFDCSGFVGWCTYQAMHRTSGEGYGYTVVSGQVGAKYKALGWGSTISRKKMKKNEYTLMSGDIGYNEGHVWIVIGQCEDKSAVIVHSTPQAGVQIAGTATPEGNYNSQAYAIAQKCMAKYYPASMKRYEYKNSAGNMIPQYSFFRWNRSALADPDGYMNKNAEQIIADLFG